MGQLMRQSQPNLARRQYFAEVWRQQNSRAQPAGDARRQDVWAGDDARNPPQSDLRGKRLQVEIRQQCGNSSAPNLCHRDALTGNQCQRYAYP